MTIRTDKFVSQWSRADSITLSHVAMAGRRYLGGHLALGWFPEGDKFNSVG